MTSNDEFEKRYETKFVIYSGNLHNILHWIKLQPNGFHKAFEDRTVNNVYFDSHNLNCYSDNLSGVSTRAKVRYRWYGKYNLPQFPGNLEIKCRRNFFGWKKTFNIKKTITEEKATWRNFINTLQRNINSEGKIWLEQYSQPIMINQYKRQYYISMDRKIRITVDTDQKVWDQRWSDFPNVSKKANLPSTVVIEFKYSVDSQKEASSLLCGFPIRVGRHSKYINGVKQITGHY